MTDLAARPVCPMCGFGMVRRTRRSDGQAFWGCPRFPDCRGTRPIDDVHPVPAPEAVSSAHRDEPGASAERQFEKRRDKHKAKVRASRPDIVARGVAIVGLGIVAIAAAPPAWAYVGWAVIAVGVLSTVARLFLLPQHVVAWGTGGEGERATATRLDVLRDAGYVVFHDRRIPMSVANIDHIVVGRSGVWVVETKSYGGRVRVRDGELRVDGRRRAGVRDEVAREVAAVSRVVAPIPVRAVVVIHRADFPLFGRLRLGDVRVLEPGDLLRHLRRGETALEPDQVADLAARIDVALPPALGG